LQELAKRLGDTSKQTLSLIERGRIKNPNSTILNKLAAEFGVTIDFLISGIEGNKHNFLQSKNSFLNSIKHCRELIGKCQTGNEYTFLFKKTENLLELFDVICNCVQFQVPDNYDLYTDNLNKLAGFIDNITMFLEAEQIEAGIETIVDQAFWRLGKTMRGFAVQIDEYGGRNLQPEELAKITELIGETLEAFNSRKNVLQKIMEVDLRGAKLSVIYRGFIDVPEEYWLDFRKRIIFEWELIMQKIKNI